MQNEFQKKLLSMQPFKYYILYTLTYKTMLFMVKSKKPHAPLIRFAWRISSSGWFVNSFILVVCDESFRFSQNLVSNERFEKNVS